MVLLHPPLSASSLPLNLFRIYSRGKSLKEYPVSRVSSLAKATYRSGGWAGSCWLVEYKGRHTLPNSATSPASALSTAHCSWDPASPGSRLGRNTNCFLRSHSEASRGKSQGQRGRQAQLWTDPVRSIAASLTRENSDL